MSDRIPFSIPGALLGWVDTDHAIGVLGVAGSVTRVFMVVGTAPSGDDFVCELNDVTGGGAADFVVTISDGTTFETETATGPLAVAADETLYIRVTEDAAAEDLSGWFEFEPSGAGSVTTFFTTLARVKTDDGIGVTTYDAQLSRIIQGVSKQMQSWMKRDIVDTTYTDEVHSGSGWDDALVLHNRPITTTTTMIVKQDDVAVDTSLYTSVAKEGVVYRVPGATGGGVWSSGSRNFKVTYSAGWTAVPEDLAMAATDQVRHEFHQSQPSSANRLGLTASTEATGGSSDYVDHKLLPSVIEVMMPYRRLV